MAMTGEYAAGDRVWFAWMIWQVVGRGKRAGSVVLYGPENAKVPGSVATSVRKLRRVS